MLKNHLGDIELNIEVKKNKVKLKLDLPEYDISDLLQNLQEYNYNVSYNYLDDFLLVNL